MADRLARWRGEAAPASNVETYDVAAWSKPRRLELAASRRWLVPLVLGWLAAALVLRVAPAPVDDPHKAIAWLIVGGAAILVLLIACAVEFVYGGTLEIDPVSRELGWRRPTAGKPSRTWSFDDITELDVHVRGAMDELRIELGGRRLRVQLPADAGAPLAASLRAAIAPSPADELPRPRST